MSEKKISEALSKIPCSVCRGNGPFSCQWGVLEGFKSAVKDVFCPAPRNAILCEECSMEVNNQRYCVGHGNEATERYVLC
jgi:hypothetical protein